MGISAGSRLSGARIARAAPLLSQNNRFNTPARKRIPTLRDLIAYADAHGAKILHYANSAGLEADAVYQAADGKYGLIEIKLGAQRIPEAEESLLRFKKAIADHGQVLPHDAAGPHVGVSDLGIAHLSVGQADGSSGGLQLRAGHFRKQAVQVRGAGGCDGVARSCRSQAEAVHDAKHDRFVHRVKILHMPRLYHKSAFP